MAPDDTDPNRRETLRGAGIVAAMSAGLAGCMGGGGNSEPTDGNGNQSSGDDVDWPPGNGTIDWTTYADEGSGTYQFHTMYGQHITKHLPEGENMNIQPTTITGAGGVTHLNTMNNQPGDGSFIGQNVQSQILNNAILRPDLVNYEPSDFGYLAQARAYTRIIAVNHRTTDVENHWDWTWQDYIDNIHEYNHATLGEGHGSTVWLRLLAHFHPDVDIDRLEQNIVHYEGGGAARAAIEREEATFYYGSFGTNYFNEEFFKTQFVITDDRQATFNDGVFEVDSNAKTLEDTDLEDEAKQTMVDLLLDRTIFLLPPDYPEEIYNTYVDGFDGVYEDDEFMANLEESRDPRVDFNPASGEELTSLIMDAWEARQNNEDLMNDLLAG